MNLGTNGKILIGGTWSVLGGLASHLGCVGWCRERKHNFLGIKSWVARSRGDVLSSLSNVAIESKDQKEFAMRHSPSLPPDFDMLVEKGFALAVQILGCEQDGADVVQDSLRKLVHSRQFDAGKGSRKAFFLKIVRNAALDTIRRRKPHDEERVASLPDAALLPDCQAERRELGQILHRELAAMDLERREIIVLRDFHDLSYAEIAEVMNVRVGTVMSRLHRARTELRQRMKRFL